MSAMPDAIATDRPVSTPYRLLVVNGNTTSDLTVSLAAQARAFFGGAAEKRPCLRGQADRQVGRGVAVDHQQAVWRGNGPIGGDGVGHGGHGTNPYLFVYKHSTKFC